MTLELKSGKPVLASFAEAGIEVDQRIAAAIKLIGGAEHKVHDGSLFYALHRLNSISARYLRVDEIKARGSVALFVPGGMGSDANGASSAEMKRLSELIQVALAQSKNGRLLTTRSFVHSVLAASIKHGDDYPKRPLTADLLIASHSGFHSYPLRNYPEVGRLLSNLISDVQSPDDFQYVLAVEDDRVVFRVVSVLDDYVESSNGVLVPRRALLTHFQERYGFFSPEQIHELEYLINSPKSREHDFQVFFEQYPHFFRRWDHREVFPQVYLTRPGSPLIPDFILTDRELQRATIVDLKLATPKLVRRQRNRDRFSAALTEARSQLLRYRDWFRDSANRTRLAEKVGMQIYEPHLAVIIGRQSEFLDEVDRQQLQADNPDIEVVTYDEMVTFARRRRTMVEGVSPR